MLHRHCWHTIEGSQRKIPIPSRCRASEPEYIRTEWDDVWPWDYILVAEVKYCCICGKRKQVKSQYNPEKAASFSGYKEVLVNTHI
jgi:hypothetical protein